MLCPTAAWRPPGACYGGIPCGARRELRVFECAGILTSDVLSSTGGWLLRACKRIEGAINRAPTTKCGGSIFTNPDQMHIEAETGKCTGMVYHLHTTLRPPWRVVM